MSDDADDLHLSADRTATVLALAAISLFESLMVSLIEKGVLSKSEAEDTVRIAIESHLHAEPSIVSDEDHRDAAKVMQRILSGANAIRAAAHL